MSKRLALVLLWLLVPVMVYAAAPAPPPNQPIERAYFPMLLSPLNQKHGLAWSYISRSPDAWDAFHVDWYYHWSSRGVTGLPASVEFVPMLWGDDFALKTAFLLNVPRNYCGRVLFANEPEFDTQSNMTIAQVVALLDWLVEHYPCATFVGPQSHVCWFELNPPAGTCPPLGERFTVEGFILAYRASHSGTNPPIYAYGLHYGNPLYWPDRIEAMLDRLGIEAKLWYTEFNYCGESAARWRVELDYLNDHPNVERYAFWSNMREDNACALSDLDTGATTWRGGVYAEYGLK